MLIQDIIPNKDIKKTRNKSLKNSNAEKFQPKLNTLIVSKRGVKERQNYSRRNFYYKLTNIHKTLKSLKLQKKLTASVVLFLIIFQTITGVFLPVKVSFNNLQISTNQTKAAGEAWYSTGGTWNYRKQITIDNTKVPNTDQTNFPILINRTDADWKDTSNSGKVAQADGGDILFTSSDGSTKLSHEIEKYNNTTGEIQAWVKIPTLSASSDTIIYMYYGNASIANQWDINNVWDTNHKMVQHLQEDPSGSAPQMTDSTSNSNNGTSGGTMTSSDQATGKIDGSLNFDGTDDKITVSDDAVLDITDTITLSTWVNVTADTTATYIISPISATGGTITYDGDFTIHTFTGNGTFDVTGSGNVEVLVVAGGGAGGSNTYAGGGGAGGLVHYNNHAVTSQAYNITVGSGGVGQSVVSVGNNGSNSVFDSISAIGGGGGGYFENINGLDGGSGGGAGKNGLGGNGSQGNSGGDGNTFGGGGGGGGVGTNGNESPDWNIGGAGGNGLVYSINGSSSYYAAGGGGGGFNGYGIGGSNIGGDGGYYGSSAATSGAANTGSGGGGAAHSASYPTAGSGGSGIVIIRYQTPNTFTNRKAITISHSGVLTDYQTKLTIAYESEMLSNFDDIRFVTDSGAHVPYWIESKTDSTTADVWIKSDLSDGDTTVWMYYGNDGLSSGSDDTDIFLTATGGAITTDGDYYVHTFEYTGVVQEFTTIDASKVKFELHGSSGMYYDLAEQGNGTKIVTDELSISDNTTYYIYVGGLSNWNGGGVGNYNGGDGTDIRTTENSEYNTRIIVAAGGGGTRGTDANDGDGGDGGLPTPGEDGGTAPGGVRGFGATQTDGGIGGTTPAADGGWGVGGPAIGGGPAGGGGYYGGGGAYYGGGLGYGGGGGGSSWHNSTIFSGITVTYSQSTRNKTDMGIVIINYLKRAIDTTEPTYTIGAEQTPSLTTILSKEDSYSLGANTTTAYATINNQTISSAISVGWNRLDLTYNKDAGGTEEMKLYINGTEATTGDYSTIIAANTNDVLLGSTLNGTMDNTRISNTVRSADWILTEHNNQNSPSTFYSLASEEEVNAAPNVPTLISPTNTSNVSDNTPTLSANYTDTDTDDTGTTNYRISSSSLVDCTTNTNVVSSGTSSTTSTNNEATTWTPSSSIGADATYYWCAQNNDGAETSAWTQMGSFNLDTTPPTITNISSDKPNSTYNIEEVIDIDVTFSENVTSTGNVTITLETGTTDQTCTFTITNTNTGTCNYTVQQGDNSTDLTVSSISGIINDQSSNLLTNFIPTTNLNINKEIIINTQGAAFISPTPPTTNPNSQTPSTQVTQTNNKATLTFNIQNASQMAISQTPDFKNVSWELYNNEKTINLDPQTTKLYIKFRSITGGETEVMEQEIIHKENSEFLLDSESKEIPEGSLVTVEGGYKVYIKKQNYLRHVSNSIIFRFYNHLKWNNIKTITKEQFNKYQISTLVRELNDTKVYYIDNNLTKHHLNLTVQQFENSNRLWDMVYIINQKERDFYEIGEDMKE